MPQVGFHKLACIYSARVSGFLMAMVVVVTVVSSTPAVINILASILLIQRQLSRLGLVGVVVSIVLWVYYQRSVQVCFHVATCFPWERHLGEDKEKRFGMIQCKRLGVSKVSYSVH